MRPAEVEVREANMLLFKPPDSDTMLRVCESKMAGCR
jgi:hypothetical protein